MPEDDYLDRLAIIVVGVDPSETCRRAVRYAVTVARGTGARLIFVHVLNTATLIGLAPAALPGVRDTAMQIGDDLERRMHEWLDSSELVWEMCATSRATRSSSCAASPRRSRRTRSSWASMRAAHRIIGSLPSSRVKSHRWPVTVVP